VRALRLAAASLALALVAGEGRAAMPPLPGGARTRWVVEAPSEIVAYALIDTARVGTALPATLRFITVGELADAGVAWAAGHLAEHPERRGCGVSFLEIVRAGTFTIDGLAPRWPRHGAMALWCARVAAAPPDTAPGPGRPLLVLGMWVPDRAFVDRARARGHFMEYGDVRLVEAPRGRWRGSLKLRDLTVAATCTPDGPVTGGDSSAGAQVLIPPRDSAVPGVVRVAFAGHRTRDCPGSTWRIRGGHALARAVVLEPSSFQYGYHLAGGAYPR
jgi:hypothetical protein